MVEISQIRNLKDLIFLHNIKNFGHEIHFDDHAYMFPLINRYADRVSVFNITTGQPHKHDRFVLGVFA